ncbi:MAG: hypothetical protein IJB41_02035, partial [Clostridia bacterium]|nr:hypothetical protein [Clostridia bacterium]
LPWAVIGAAIAEWLGASQGLGYFSKRMMTKLDGSAVFAAVLLLSVLALIGLSLIKWLDRKWIVWRSEVRSRNGRKRLRFMRNRMYNTHTGELVHAG